MGRLALHSGHCGAMSSEFCIVENHIRDPNSSRCNSNSSTRLFNIEEKHGKECRFLFYFYFFLNSFPFFFLSRDWVAPAHGLGPQNTIVHLEFGSKMDWPTCLQYPNIGGTCIRSEFKKFHVSWKWSDTKIIFSLPTKSTCIVPNVSNSQ